MLCRRRRFGLPLTQLLLSVCWTPPLSRMLCRVVSGGCFAVVVVRADALLLWFLLWRMLCRLTLVASWWMLCHRGLISLVGSPTLCGTEGAREEELRALLQEARSRSGHMAEEGEEAVPPPAAMVGEEDAAAGEAPPPAVDFGLPAELMSVLPSDPFAQLDVARKITSIALSHRLGCLEAEAARLRSQLAERDAEAEDLRERVEQLDAALAVATGRLRRAEEEKEALLRDNSALSNTVTKLNRDVAKLEVFRKTLVQSLQEDDSSDNTAPTARVAATSNFSSAPSDEDSAFPTSKSSQISETASSVPEENSQVDPDAPRPPRPGRQHVFLPSYNSTPRMTPPGSPPRRFASVSPPRRHSISVTSMNMFNDRSSGFSGQHSSPFDAPSQTGRTRVDGKEFFRQVRNRLSYEQFGAFLANVKELNAHRQTREDTLRKADEIFGPENKDLYTIFESLITRNIR